VVGRRSVLNASPSLTRNKLYKVIISALPKHIWNVLCNVPTVVGTPHTMYACDAQSYKCKF
jgi:hypothetical protein